MYTYINTDKNFNFLKDETMKTILTESPIVATNRIRLGCELAVRNPLLSKHE